MAAGTLLVLLTARGLLSCLGLKSRHPALLLCAYWVAAGTVIHASVLLAGKTALLSAAGIAGYQLIFLGICLVTLRKQCAFPSLFRRLLSDVHILACALSAALFPQHWTRSRTLPNLLSLSVGLIVIVLGVVAIGTPMVNHDTNLYRLPRIGMWLLDNHIGHFDASMVEMNFVGRSAEFLSLWLITFFQHGFPLIHLVQWASGAVTLAATYELARRLRLPPILRWTALVLILGTPNLLVQFTTSQTDLTACAYATAGLVLLLCALGRRRVTPFLLAGAAFGLAVGTKQTMLLWAPGYAALTLVWLLQRGIPWENLMKPALAAGLAMLPFCLPLYWENHLTYGDWLVPREFSRDYPSLQPTERVRPLFYPAILLYQHTWPVTQTPILAPPLSWLHEASLEIVRKSTIIGNGQGGVPKKAADLVAFMNIPRFGDSFIAPSVLVTFTLFLAFPLLIFSLLRTPGRIRCESSLGFILGSWVFFLCSLRFGWEIYSIRFWVIPAPIMVLAVVALPRLVSPVSQRSMLAWALFLVVMHLPITLRGMWLHSDNGLLTLLDPRQTSNGDYARAMGELAASLDRRHRKILCSVETLWTSVLFRGKNAHDISLSSAPILDPGAALTSGRYDTLILDSRQLPNPRPYVVRIIPPLYGAPIYAIRLPEEGEVPTGTTTWREGYFSDGWIAPRAVLEIRRAQTDTLSISFRNMNPTPMDIQISGRTGTQTFTLPPLEWSQQILSAAAEDELTFQTDKVYHAPGDNRELGVLTRLDDVPGSPTF